jgi:hypothetical protein
MGQFSVTPKKSIGLTGRYQLRLEQPSISFSDESHVYLKRMIELISSEDELRFLERFVVENMMNVFDEIEKDNQLLRTCVGLRKYRLRIKRDSEKWSSGREDGREPLAARLFTLRTIRAGTA